MKEIKSLEDIAFDIALRRQDKVTPYMLLLTEINKYYSEEYLVELYKGKYDES
jgi:hypothetical protein